jgi:ribosomal protein S12 methylthiotransferase
MVEWSKLSDREEGSPRASIVSLGCAKNLVDSEMMAPQLIRLGFTITEDLDGAWLLVVNTCGFLESAVEEAIQTILELASRKENGSCGCLVVTGCMVQRYGRKLLSLLPEVDVFLGTSHTHRLDSALLSWEAERERRLWIGPPRQLFDSSAPRVRSTPAPSAYIKIADGCDNRCTYCMIPRLRGPYRSRAREDVVREATMLAAEGVKEVNLIAQDTTAFGLDRGEQDGLVRLVESLEEVDGLRWIRLLYVYPDRIREGLLSTMAQSAKVVPYLDIPLQHCEPRILGAMGRNCPQSGMEALIDLIRSHLPHVTLRTSLMVGFPGETESDFGKLVNFLERMMFDHVGVFSFSPEAGSSAAGMGGQVSGEVKEARRRVLMEAQMAISRNKLGSLVGRVMPVLVEGLHPETELLLRGRLPGQAPEVDGMVMITEGTALVGDIRAARITEAHDYDVEARLLGPHERADVE